MLAIFSFFISPAEFLKKSWSLK